MIVPALALRVAGAQIAAALGGLNIVKCIAKQVIALDSLALFTTALPMFGAITLASVSTSL
jgi:hypothetical protein